MRQLRLGWGGMSVALGLVLCWPAGAAQAAGFFLAPHGVRPLARGGAFVAGADDVNALSYNPAGVAEAKPQILLDVGMPLYSTTYTRQVFAGGAALPTVQGQPFGLPSPTLGAILRLPWVKGLSVGVGVAADYPTLQRWPATLPDGQPAPQRYSVINYDGTLIMKGALAVAYRVAPWLSVGASLQLLFGNFVAELTASTCDGVICTQPEDPSYDATIQMLANGILQPGVQLGVIAKPTPWLRLGAAWESGYTIHHAASFRVRLPTAAAYGQAYVDPAQPTGSVQLALPMQLRFGAELRPWRGVRTELAFIFTPWSVQQSIGTDLGGAFIRNVAGIGDYELGALQVPRDFRDTWSLRWGTEWRLPWMARRVVASFGAAYEPAALAPADLTPATVDLNKILVSVGAAYTVGRWRIELTYAHLFMPTTVVQDSAIHQVNPTRPPFPAVTPVGNGVYTGRADIFGASVAFRL